MSAAVVLFIAVTGAGCATVLNGYEDTVVLTNIPEGTKVFDQHAMEKTIFNKQKLILVRKSDGSDVLTGVTVGHYITLRSNTDHILTFRNGGEEKRVHLYPKLSAGWLLLDIITLTFPVDMYTGCWNHFDDIDYQQLRD
jgi:hypothetical protein